MGLFDELERNTAEIEDVPIVRAPFGYIGSKLHSAKYILPFLPYRNSYIEVFGGSGVVLINRRPSKLDVYNDRFGGIVAFYRCIKDKNLCDELIQWLDVTIHAKEEYHFCKQTWKDCTDLIERAGRWYYSMSYSFGNKGAVWGRTVSSTPQAGMIRNKLTNFDAVHRRFANVQIENCSWEKILNDYDHEDAVFYLDPPYVGTSNDGYHYNMSHDDHRRMLETIMSMEGFVALSGFANSLYDGYDWDARHTWKVKCTLAGNANNEGNKKAHLKGLECYHDAEEVLWIKEAR